MLGGLGLGVIANQLADLQLGELLDTPPPGLDEAVAIAKVRPFGFFWVCLCFEPCKWSWPAHLGLSMARPAMGVKNLMHIWSSC